MKSKVLSALAVAILFPFIYGCNDDSLLNENKSEAIILEENSGTVEFDNFFSRKKEIAMKDFSEALLQIISENSEVRALIKSEALKMFNKDTEDLALHLLEQDVKGQSLYQLFESNLKGKTSLKEIFQILPTLTILVPELPEDSFSAKKWDTNFQVPNIAIRTEISNDTPVIGMVNNKIEFDVIPSDEIPGDPILVVKTNERVVSSQDANFSQLKTKEVFSSRLMGMSFKFLDNAFDPFFVGVTGDFTKRNKIHEAFYITSNSDTWQRDHIYYGINSTNLRGTYDYNYKECITSIQPVAHNGNAYGAYVKISDHINDPSYNPTLNAKNNFTHWTDGGFEFIVHIMVNTPNGPLVGDTKKSIVVAPQDIFELEYTHYTKSSWVLWRKNYYKLTKISSKNYECLAEIFHWKLDELSTTLIFSLEEFDGEEKYYKNISHSSKIATNFELDSNLGEKVKVGKRFGATNELIRNYTHQIETTKGSDALGNFIVEFGNPTIVGKNNNSIGDFGYIYNKYSTGVIELTVRPVKLIN